MSRRRLRGQQVDGLLVVDKPSGPTSAAVVAAVRRLTGAAKVGHAGTLDPMATGLLLVCLGEGTKTVPWLMDAPKTYEATVLLGVETDTLDADGEEVARNAVPELAPAEVAGLLARFEGDIEQVPPVYSALRRDGERLHEKARRGEDVDLAPRTVRAYDLTLVELAPPVLELRVTCGKGFYVRSLARDIGAELGCGAHLTALRRTASAGFDVAAAFALSALEEGRPTWQEALLPVEVGLTQLPAVVLSEADSLRASNGNPVACPDEPLIADGADARLCGPDGGLIAVARRTVGLDGVAVFRVIRGFGPR